jgi:hypothetical protein
VEVSRHPAGGGPLKSISPEEEIFMVRRLSLLLGLVFLFSMSAHAQSAWDKVDLYAGASYMRLDNPSNTNLYGWNLSGQYKITGWLGGVADLSGNYGSGDSVHTFLFGPQVTWRAKYSPFAHLLFGGAHFNGGGLSSTSFSVAAGFGVDRKITHGLTWRILQADYVRTNFLSITQGNLRASTGIVFRF